MQCAADGGVIVAPLTVDLARETCGGCDRRLQPPFDGGDGIERVRTIQTRAAPASVRAPRSMIWRRSGPTEISVTGTPHSRSMNET